MTHDQIIAEIQRRAKARGMLSHYCRRSVTCNGDRGLPDLFLAGHFAAAWLEVKTPSCPNLTPEQTTWAHCLRAAGQTHYVVGPVQLANGVVDQILDYLALGQQAA